MRWESFVMLIIYNVVVPYSIVHSTLGSPWDYVVGIAAFVVSVRVWVKANKWAEKVRRSAVYRMVVGE